MTKLLITLLASISAHVFAGELPLQNNTPPNDKVAVGSNGYWRLVDRSSVITLTTRACKKRPAIYGVWREYVSASSTYATVGCWTTSSKPEFVVLYSTSWGTYGNVNYAVGAHPISAFSFHTETAAAGVATKPKPKPTVAAKPESAEVASARQQLQTANRIYKEIGGYGAAWDQQRKAKDNLARALMAN